MTRNSHTSVKKKKKLARDERTFLKFSFKISELSYNHSISLSCCFFCCCCCFLFDECLLITWMKTRILFFFLQIHISLFRSCVGGSTIIDVFFVFWDTTEYIMKELEASCYWLKTFFFNHFAPLPFNWKQAVCLASPLPHILRLVYRDCVLHEIPSYFYTTNKWLSKNGVNEA